ncbi:hypothetical protein M413DRAFT_448738, partial [Hebeloma cylindrosporum]
MCMRLLGEATGTRFCICEVGEKTDMRTALNGQPPTATRPAGEGQISFCHLLSYLVDVDLKNAQHSLIPLEQDSSFPFLHTIGFSWRDQVS